jgi:hypothetical protein
MIVRHQQHRLSAARRSATAANRSAVSAALLERQNDLDHVLDRASVEGRRRQ